MIFETRIPQTTLIYPDDPEMLLDLQPKNITPKKEGWLLLWLIIVAMIRIVIKALPTVTWPSHKLIIYRWSLAVTGLWLQILVAVIALDLLENLVANLLQGLMV